MRERALRKPSRGLPVGLGMLFLLSLVAQPLPAREDAYGREDREEDSAQKARKNSSAKKKGSSRAAEQEEEEKPAKGMGFNMRRHPEITFGEVLRLDFVLKYQSDFRWWTPEHQLVADDFFDLRRMRLSLEARFLKDWEFEIEREIREDLGEREVTFPWRNVYVNYRHFSHFQVEAGKFKIPFGMDRLTSAMNQDFVTRSLIGDYIAPARDIGIMLHGRFFNRGLNYQFGLFKQDGENAKFKDFENDQVVALHSGQRTFAGRVTGTPLRFLPVPAVFKTVTLGLALTQSPVPEGLKGLRGQTPVSSYSFFKHVFVRGHRFRVGTEMSWTPGPFSVKGEFMHASDQRKGQGLRGNDLSDLISRGWYLSGSWVVTGEKKAGGVRPRKDFLWGHGGHGIGAIEMAARYEQLAFGSAEHPGLPSRSNRAANILGNSDRVWTLGFNWYMNRFVKVQGDWIREHIEDNVFTTIPGKHDFWTRLVRLQFML